MKALSDFFANASGVFFVACFLFIGLAVVAAMGPLWLFWTMVLITFGLGLLSAIIWALVAMGEEARQWSHEHHWFDSHRGAH